MKPVIGLDMDGIIAGFCEASVEEYDRVMGTMTETYLLYEEIFGDHVFLSEELEQKRGLFDMIWKTKGFFRNLPVLPYAQNSVLKLTEYYDIMIISTPYPGNESCSHEKEEWLKEHFPHIDKIFFTPRGHKEYIVTDVFIDDNVKNVTLYKKRNKNSITASIKYPWTNENTHDIVSNTWLDLSKELIKIARHS